jgi:hypothetical protein
VKRAAALIQEQGEKAEKRFLQLLEAASVETGKTVVAQPYAVVDKDGLVRHGARVVVVDARGGA